MIIALSETIAIEEEGGRVLERISKIISLIVVMVIFAGTAFAGEKVYYYHTDPAGTPLAMTDANGNVVWRADYRPFGEEQSVTQTPENDMRFVGKEKDKETGLQYFGARYMRPEIGRFISPDPIGPVDPWTSKTNYKMLENPQLLNRYVYSLNNPYRYLDPNGKWPTEYYKLHQISIGRSLSGLLKDDRNILNAQQVRMDDDPAYSDPNMHAMARPGQSAEEAWKGANDFVRSELSWARELERNGQHEAALVRLGNAIHTMQDETSPAHHGYQVWHEESSNLSKFVTHTSRELMDPGRGSNLDAAARRANNIFRSNGPIPLEVLPRP